MIYSRLLVAAITIILPIQVLAGPEGLDLLKQIRENKKTRYLSGWIQGDAAWYNNVPSGLMDDGTELRRGILNLQAKIYNNVGYKIQYDFVNSGKSGLKDAYLVYSKSEALNFIVGNTKDPFMLQDQISSRYTLFTERALPRAFTAGRHLGLVTHYFGKEDWVLSAGLFGPAANTTSDTDRDRGWGGSMRTIFAPINDENKLLHVGFSANYRDTQQQNAVRYNQQPETNIAGVNFVDTGDIEHTQNTQKIAAEIATTMGAWSIQSEYVVTAVDRSGGDLRFNGGYAQASYIFTGEHRYYEKGIFRGVKPNRSVDSGGIGAWESGLRISTVDLTDKDINGGEMNDITVGINWYPTNAIRLSANYIKVLRMDGGPQDGIKPNIFQVRLQWEFDHPFKQLAKDIQTRTGSAK